MKIVLLCTLLLNLPTYPEHSEAMATCLVIAQEAELQQQSVPMLISLAWHESRLRWTARSNRGAVGPLQILPRFWMRDTWHSRMIRENCSRCPDCCVWTSARSKEVEAGVRAFKYWLSKSSGMVEAVAKYNAGHKPPKKAFRFANRVVALADALSEETAQ